LPQHEDICLHEEHRKIQGLVLNKEKGAFKIM